MTTDRDRYRCQSTIAPGAGRCYFDAVVFNGETDTMHCAGHALEPDGQVDLEALADFATKGGGHLLHQLPKHVGLIVIRDVREAIRKGCETTIGEKRQHSTERLMEAHRHFLETGEPPAPDRDLHFVDVAVEHDQLAGDRRTGPLTPEQLERGLRPRKKPRDLDDV